MSILPRPHIPFIISVVLAIPTYGISLAVFYFVFKRPYDSVATSAILAEAKRSMETRRASQLFNVNPGGIERVFSKFSEPGSDLKYGAGTANVRWGVLRHPMLNNGEPFTLRVDIADGNVTVEASPGKAWWLLTDRVWLGRRGTAPGLPARVLIGDGSGVDDKECSDPESTATGLLLTELAHWKEEIEIPSLTYGHICDFASSHNASGEWFPDYQGCCLYLDINKRSMGIRITNLDPSKEDDGGIRISATVLE